MKLILASTSPRRKQLLQQLDITFEIVAPLFEECSTNLSPSEESLSFARNKALSVAAQHPSSWILASDTLVAIQGQKLGKPQNEADAIQMLQQLSGQSHTIFTAVALLNTATKLCQEHLETVKVTFRTLTDLEITNYVATGEPMDKAGAYAIQGGAQDFVTSIDGDLNAVIGLPLEPIKHWLKIISAKNDDT